jgi:predicted DCC family thiol-disulfide oxidoreductase YuxK
VAITTPLLLYDGTCGFCAGSVQFILARDRNGSMRFAALDSVAGRAVLERNPHMRDFDSVLFIEPPKGEQPERVFAHSDAALRAASYLGGPWRLVNVARIIPRPLRDAVYRLIARHRHRLSGARPQCVVPSAGDRARFLE